MFPVTRMSVLVPAVTPQSVSGQLPREMIEPFVATERARAERVLNGVRAAVVPVLGLGAVVYAPALSHALILVNLAVLAPFALWTAAQYLLFFRGHRPVPPWLGTVNPIVDITAVTALLLGYGLSPWPMLGVRAPIFLLYFAIIAARPMTGSTRDAAVTALAAVVEYGLLLIALTTTGRITFANDPLTAAASGGVSLMDEGARLMLLAVGGAIATFATAWHERLLRRALAAQVARASDEQALVVRLQEADKLAALGTLAASIAHEVNNPLTTITTLAGILHEDAATDQQRADALAVGQEARRTMRIVHDLLGFARAGDDRRGPVALSDVAERALSVLRVFLRDQKITVERVLERDGAVVHGEAGALERVVLNLVINAAQALEESAGSKVVRVSCGHFEREAWLSVEDTGPGFPPGVVDRIFDRFFTTKPEGKGTGLGLWIVQRTVADHGGAIRAENRTDRTGARFTLRIPLATPAPMPAPAAAPAPPPSYTPPRPVFAV